jgi:hypothetical protein
LEAALQADLGNEVRPGGLKHQRRSAAMECDAGLDVSVKETSVCIVDKASKVEFRPCPQPRWAYAPQGRVSLVGHLEKVG